MPCHLFMADEGGQAAAASDTHLDGSESDKS